MRALRQWHHRQTVVRGVLLVWWLSASMLLCQAATAISPASASWQEDSPQTALLQDTDVQSAVGHSHDPAIHQHGVSDQRDLPDCHTVPCHVKDTGAAVDGCCSNVEQGLNVSSKQTIELSVQYALMRDWVSRLWDTDSVVVPPVSTSGFLLSYSPPPVFLRFCAFLK